MMQNNVIDKDDSKHHNDTTLLAEEHPYYDRTIPTVVDLFEGLTIEMKCGIGIVFGLFIIVQALFCQQIPKILKNTPKRHVARTIILCGIYPIVSASALVSTLVPKAMVLCDSLNHMTFTFCAYQFFCLCLEYTDGESNFIKVAEEVNVFNLRSPPCCCLCWLQPQTITKRNFLIVRTMILQMPIIQSIILISVNIINFESPRTYNMVFVYFIPFLVLSIITGIWGLQITFRMIAPYFLEYKLKGKFFAMQLVLILTKLQPLIIQGIMALIPMSPVYPITQKVINNTIFQVLFLAEMVLMSLWAHKLYRSPSKHVAEYASSDREK